MDKFRQDILIPSCGPLSSSVFSPCWKSCARFSITSFLHSGLIAKRTHRLVPGIKELIKTPASYLAGSTVFVWRTRKKPFFLATELGTCCMFSTLMLLNTWLLEVLSFKLSHCARHTEIAMWRNQRERLCVIWYMHYKHKDDQFLPGSYINFSRCPKYYLIQAVQYWMCALYPKLVQNVMPSLPWIQVVIYSL